MSFRKRGEAVNVAGLRRNGPVPSPVQRSSLPVQRNTHISMKKPVVEKNPITKPSLVFTSESCISSGTSDFDKVLQHNGIPLGSLMLLEEDGTTDFTSRLIKVFLSEGVIQNRLEELNKKHLTHSIVIGMQPQWSAELPGLYLGSSKDRKKQLVKDQEGKLSVSNVVNSNQNDMKIAWRYGLQKKTDNNNNTTTTNNDNDNYPYFNHQFDITTNIRPAAGPTDITNIPIEMGYERILVETEKIVSKFKDQVIRISIPYFLNPMVYLDKGLTNQSNVIKFIYGLKRIVRKYKNRVVLMMSVNAKLYTRDTKLIRLLESLCDGVVQLRPFPHELNELLDRTFKREPTKIHQGYLNIYKVPILSEMGLMEVREMEYSFKNSKRRFEIEEWSIPVEADEVEEKSKSLEF